MKMLGKNYTPKEYEKALHKLQAKRKAEKRRKKKEQASKPKLKKTAKAKLKKKKLTPKQQHAQDLKDVKWTKKRTEIMTRDNFTCTLCGSHDNLQVHHKVYIDGKRLWEYGGEHLVTLCRKCHELVHGDPNHEWHEKYIHKKKEKTKPMVAVGGSNPSYVRGEKTVMPIMESLESILTWLMR